MDTVYAATQGFLRLYRSGQKRDSMALHEWPNKSYYASVEVATEGRLSLSRMGHHLEHCETVGSESSRVRHRKEARERERKKKDGAIYDFSPAVSMQRSTFDCETTPHTQLRQPSTLRY